MKTVVVFCLLFFLGSAASFIIITYQALINYSNQIQFDLSVLQERVASNFISTSNDLRTALELPELSAVIQANTLLNRSLLAKTFEQLIASNPSYTQLRFINQKGDEVVRVNQTKNGIIIVPENSLQNKFDRYYFADTMKLEKGEYYISPLDLNIEGSKVVVPYEPTLRLSTPVFNAENKKIGIVIINFDARQVLSELEKKDDDDPRYRIYFANSDGDWFRGPSTEDDWAFMFPNAESHRARTKFPLLWSKILTNDSGSILTREGYFIFGKIKPINLVQQNKVINDSFSYFSRYLQVRDYYMVVIAHVSRELIPRLLFSQVIGINLFFIVFSGIGFGLAGALFAKKITK